MIEPNTANRCANPEDANWAAPFLFGRWAWDGYLFGARITGPGSSLIDATYDYGFGRLRGKLPREHARRLPDQLLQHRLQRRVRRVGSGQQGPPRPGDPRLRVHDRQRAERAVLVVGEPAVPEPGRAVGRHPPGGGQRVGAARVGIANANLVLLDSLVAQRADGALIVGRGVPNAWIARQLADRGDERARRRRRASGRAHHAARQEGHAGAVPARASGPVLSSCPLSSTTSRTPARGRSTSAVARSHWRAAPTR